MATRSGPAPSTAGAGPVRAPAGASANPNRGVPLSRLTREFDQKIHAIASSYIAAAVLGVWDEALLACQSRP
ncbi:hypothetical protein GCM10020000_00190 [Streptomyces olivoverticillatus]